MANRQALGRNVAIGELYDIRSDCICNTSMFQAGAFISTRVLKVEDLKIYTFQPLDAYNYCQILSTLGVEEELQLSVATKLCEVKRLSAYLMIQAEAVAHPRKEVYGIFCTYKSKKAILCLDGQCSGIIAKKSLKLNGQGTHVVEEVTYGVNALICLEFEGIGIKEQAKEDSLKNLLKILKNVLCGQHNDKYQNVITFLDRNCKVQIFSDLLSTGMHMKSVQDALNYIKSLPTLTTDMVIPLNFGLMPISKVRNLLNPNCNVNQQFCTVPHQLVFQIIKRLDVNISTRQMVGNGFNVLQTNNFCVSIEDLKKMMELRTSFQSTFTKFRQELTAMLTEVRWGRKPSSVLQKFCAGVKPDASENARKLLAGFTNSFKKVEFVNEMIQNGARYVNKDVLLDNIVTNSNSKDVCVLHFTTRARNANQAQLDNHKNKFLKSIVNPNTIGVLFDHDFSSDEYSCQIQIDHYKNGRLIGVPSVPLASRVSLASLVKGAQDLIKNLCYAQSPEVRKTIILPKKRAYVHLPCPGTYKSNCGKDTKTWYCNKCSSMLMYGFDEMFYCSCGSALLWSYSFMCSDDNHGAEYVPVPVSDLLIRAMLTQALRSLVPLHELNILLMGETGVGKSTWINSFVNYLTYETMEEAEREGPRYLIGSSFVMTDEKYQPVEIKMGMAENENNSKGQSTTQMPNSYVFSAGELLVRLVDTPGVGDTRGIEQDKVNFQNVLSHLSHLEDIHGICILLKSNSARMTITFQFCIKELLTHLHKDACKNIVFVFTNARETFYRPGDTFPTLRTLLLENKDIVIELGKETIYCMDNEAVRFLAATKQGMVFRPEDKANYSISWETSVAENERLVQHILSLKAHSTRKTLSLNEARRLILGLTEPLAQISQNIQNNIILAKNRRDEINDMVRKSGDLKDKLNIPVMDLESKPLPYPRTVCTSSNCTEHIEIDGVTKINYKTWCHEHCYLKNVLVQQYPCPELQNCAAMANTDYCIVCGCSWNVHMHITYECVEVMTKTVDKNIQRLLSKEGNSIKAVEAVIRNIEQRVANLKHEQEIINKVASKCGNFLKQNAITPYNDSVDEYLQQCIRIQKDVVYSGGSDQTLRGLEKMLTSYRQEVKILEMSMKNPSSGPKIGPDDIPKLIGELYKLPINGKTLKDFGEVAMNAKMNMKLYQENVYHPPSNKKSVAGFLINAWNRAMTLAKNSF